MPTVTLASALASIINTGVRVGTMIIGPAVRTGPEIGCPRTYGLSRLSYSAEREAVALREAVTSMTDVKLKDFRFQRSIWTQKPTCGVTSIPPDRSMLALTLAPLTLVFQSKALKSTPIEGTPNGSSPPGALLLQISCWSRCMYLNWLQRGVIVWFTGVGHQKPLE